MDDETKSGRLTHQLGRSHAWKGGIAGQPYRETVSLTSANMCQGDSGEVSDRGYRGIGRTHILRENTMKHTCTLSVLLVFGLVLVATPERTRAVTGQVVDQRKVVITGVDVGRRPTGVGDAVVYPDNTTEGKDSYGYVAYNRSSGLMLVVGQPTQGTGSPDIFNYALVDVASGRLVRPAETFGDRVYAVGIDSQRQRAYLLLIHSTSSEGGQTVLQSIDMRTGKTIARHTTYYQIIASILADTAPINRIVVDPQSGNLFARMVDGDGNPGLVELTPDGRTITGRKFQSSPGYYTDAKDLEINGPGHQVIALVGDGSTLEFFDTRTLKASILPLGYAPVQFVLGARHNQLWALAPGGDVVVYNAVTGRVVAHIVDNDAAFDNAVDGTLVQPILAINAASDVGYIGCRSDGEKGCSVDALYTDKRGRVLVDRGPAQLLGVDAGVRVEQDPPYNDNQPPTQQSFVRVYAPGRAPRALVAAPVDRMASDSLSEFMATAAGVTRVVWLGKISGHNGLTGSTIDDGLFIDNVAG